MTIQAFLTTQIAFTGLPLLLFFAFSLTVFLFSLIAALLIGLIAALLFTVFMLGVALVVILPTVFLTTFAASFVYLWGLGGYYLMTWYIFTCSSLKGETDSSQVQRRRISCT